MKVISVGNRGSDLSAEVLSASGNMASSVFHLTIGREYAVYAMALWRSGLGVLVLDDVERPHWYHLDLFNVVNNHLPNNWEFKSYHGEDKTILALWGYRTLIQNPDHHDDLINRKIVSLKAFLRECDRDHHVELDDRKVQRLEALVAESSDRFASEG